MIYLPTGTIAVAATKTPLIIGGTANMRFRIKKFDVSTTGVPTSDQSVEYQVRRATALGTSTAVTLKAADPSDEGLTPTLSAGSNCTIEPTYSTGFLADRAQNARATWTWTAYSIDDEMVGPAVASNGIGFQIQAAGGAAGNCLVNSSVQQ